MRPDMFFGFPRATGIRPPQGNTGWPIGNNGTGGGVSGGGYGGGGISAW